MFPLPSIHPTVQIAGPATFARRPKQDTRTELAVLIVFIRSKVRTLMSSTTVLTIAGSDSSGGAGIQASIYDFDFTPNKINFK